MKKILISFISVFAIVVLSSNIYSYAKLQEKKAKYQVPSQDEEFYLESNLFTSVDNMGPAVQNPMDLSEFTTKVENENLELYVHPKNASVRIRNKETGYIWTSDYTDLSVFDTGEKQNTAKSGFVIQYLTSKGAVAIPPLFASNRANNLVVTAANDVVTIKVDNKTLGFKFNYTITLKDNSIALNIDHNSIQETKENKILSFTPFQYFGAVYKNETPGYLFVPSGNGGLVKYSENPTIRTEYSASFYGTDYNRTANTQGEVLSLPIYGFKHGSNDAVLAEVTSGAPFAKFVYSPNSVTGFDMSYVTFNLREQYSIRPKGSTDSITMTPEDIYPSDLGVEYNFLSNENANYVGMAKNYQQTLVERNVLTRNHNVPSKIHIDVFGQDYEKGLFTKKYFNMTTVDDLVQIDNQFKRNNLSNIYYTLRGFNKGGYSNSGKEEFKFNKKLGDLDNLSGMNYDIYYNPVEFYTPNSKGKNNTLITINNNLSTIMVEEGVKYLNIANVKSVVNNAKKSLNKNYTYAIDGLSSSLYGDKNNNYSRLDTLELYDNLITEKTAMFNPNYYYLDVTSKYLNMNLYHDRLKFITDSVPFLEILLRGYIDYYSPYLNFSSNKALDILKCIEYGTYPSFLITNQESYLLVNSLSNDMYATTFSRIEQNIYDAYGMINDALDQVTNATIENRVVLEKGFVRVDYSNGRSIYVNYTTDSKTDPYTSVTVSKETYKVV